MCVLAPEARTISLQCFMFEIILIFCLLCACSLISFVLFLSRFFFQRVFSRFGFLLFCFLYFFIFLSFFLLLHQNRFLFLLCIAVLLCTFSKRCKFPNSLEIKSGFKVFVLIFVHMKV